MDNFMLIDIAITPFSSEDDIQVWLDTLNEMDQNRAEVQQAIKQTATILDKRRDLLGNNTNNPV